MRRVGRSRLALLTGALLCSACGFPPADAGGGDATTGTLELKLSDAQPGQFVHVRYWYEGTGDGMLAAEECAAQRTVHRGACVDPAAPVSFDGLCPGRWGVQVGLYASAGADERPTCNEERLVTMCDTLAVDVDAGRARNVDLDCRYTSDLDIHVSFE